MEVHDSPVKYAAITEKGNFAVTYSSFRQGTAKLWSLETMQCKASVESAHGQSMCCLKDRLLLGSREGPIKVWDISVSTPVALLDLQGHRSVVVSIAASETHNVVLSGSRDVQLRLWDVRTGMSVRTMEGHTNTVTSVGMDSACGIGISGSFDKTVMTWDLGTGKCIDTFQHEQEVFEVGIRETGSTFFSHDGDYCLRIFSTADAGHKATKTVNLKATCGVQKPHNTTNAFWDMKVAAKRDLSCFATSFRTISHNSSKSMMWQ